MLMRLFLENVTEPLPKKGVIQFNPVTNDIVVIDSKTGEVTTIEVFGARKHILLQFSCESIKITKALRKLVKLRLKGRVDDVQTADIVIISDDNKLLEFESNVKIQGRTCTLYRPITRINKSPYHRQVTKRCADNGFMMDMYDVLEMWKTDNSSIDHVVKKLLNPGTRGDNNKDRIKDLEEAYWSLGEAIKIEKGRK